MRKIVLALIPVVLLAGCSNRQEEARKRDEAKKAELTRKIDEYVSEVETTWDRIPPAVRESPWVQRTHQGIENSTQYMRDRVARNDFQLIQEDIGVGRIYMLDYLKKAVHADSDYKRVEEEFAQVKALLNKLCPNNKRAATHLNFARLDLDTCAANGYAIDIRAIAERELQYIREIATNPFEQPQLSSFNILKAREQLFLLRETQAPLTERQKVHLDAAEQCILLHRQAVAKAGDSEELLEMTYEHLRKCSPGSCEKDQQDTSGKRSVELFEKILETENFIAQNCPDNKAASALIAKARDQYEQYRKNLSNSRDYTDRGEIRKLVDAARENIGNNPRKGSR